MEIKYGDIVRTRRKSCRTCLTLIYQVPCEVDASLATHLSRLGSLKFDLNVVKLFRIDVANNYSVKTKLGSTLISLALPKHLGDTDIQNNQNKLMFEDGLIAWLEARLEIDIVK